MNSLIRIGEVLDCGFYCPCCHKTLLGEVTMTTEFQSPEGQYHPTMMIPTRFSRLDDFMTARCPECAAGMQYCDREIVQYVAWLSKQGYQIMNSSAGYYDLHEAVTGKSYAFVDHPSIVIGKATPGYMRSSIIHCARTIARSDPYYLRHIYIYDSANPINGNVRGDTDLTIEMHIDIRQHTDANDEYITRAEFSEQASRFVKFLELLCTGMKEA